MNFCFRCLPLGYCRRQIAYLVTDSELTPAFVQDGRNFGGDWAKARKLSPEQFPQQLQFELATTYRGVIIDPMTEQEAGLDTESLYRRLGTDSKAWDAEFGPEGDPLSRPDTDIRKHYRENYFEHCGPRPHISNRERLRTVLTILRALNPRAASLWGIRADNDNDLAR